MMTVVSVNLDTFRLVVPHLGDRGIILKVLEYIPHRIIRTGEAGEQTLFDPVIRKHDDTRLIRPIAIFRRCNLTDIHVDGHPDHISTLRSSTEKTLDSVVRRARSWRMVLHPRKGILLMSGTDLLGAPTGTVVGQRSEAGQGILGDKEGKGMWV